MKIDTDVFPVSFKDPRYAAIDASTQQRLGLPIGLLSAVRTRGERSNADAVSSAGAVTPYQITPKTRSLAIHKYGIDPTISPENASEVAGRLLKDSLDRNGGSVPAAIAEYHGGTDRANWGPITKAYVQRVTGALPSTDVPPNPTPPAPGGSTFDRAMAATDPDAGKTSIANVYKAYQSGQMAPEDAKAFEAQVNDGHMLLPRGAELKPAPAAAPGAAPAATDKTVPLPMLQAFASGQMKPEDAADFKALVASGDLVIPKELTTPVPPTPAPQDSTGGLLPAAEVGGALASGAVAAPLAGLAGLGTMAGNALGLTNADPGDVVRSVSGALTYQPRTQQGQDNLATVTAPLQALASGADKAGGFVTDLTGSPAAGAAVNTGIQALPQVLLGKGLGAARGAVADIAARVPDLSPAAMAIPELAENPRAAASQGAEAANPAAVAAAAPVAAPAVPPTPAAAAVAPVPAVAAPLSAADLAATTKTAANGGLGSKKAMDVLAGETSPDPETVAAASRLGVEDYLQPDHVTTNQAYRELAQAVKSVPGSAASALEKTGLEQVAKKADEIVSDLGGTKDASSLSADVRSSLENTQKQLSDKADDLYGELRDKIPAATPAPATNVLSFIGKRADELGGVKNLTPMEKTIVEKLSPTGESLDYLGEAAKKQLADQGITGEKHPTYALLDDVRKDLGNAARQSGPFKDADTGLAKKLYSLLSDDQSKVVDQFGMSDTHTAAKAAVVMRKGIEDDLASLFGKRLDGSIVSDLTNGTLALQKGDTSRFVNLIQSVPKDLRQQVAASGLQSVFAKNARDGALNFHSYANWYEGLEQNRQAYNALMSNLPPEAATTLRDLATVARGISKASRERIVTGRIQAVKDELQGADSLLSSVYGIARRAAGNALANEVITTPMGIPGAGIGAAVTSAFMKGKPSVMKAADALIASPEFIAAAKAKGPAQKTAVNKLAQSPKFSAFVKSAGTPEELTKRQTWILQALQANNGPKK